MATYYIEVTVSELDGSHSTHDIMKNQNMPVDAGKQIAGSIANGGFLKEDKGLIETGDDASFTFYPPSRVLQVDLKPEDIIQVGA